MAHLDGFSIFGGIVFIFVSECCPGLWLAAFSMLNALSPVALVIYPVSFRLPLSLSEQLRKVGRALRLLEQKEERQTQAHELSNVSSNGNLPVSQVEQDKPKPIRIRIGLSSAPLLGVLLLLITTSIGGNEIAKGIAGSEGVRPYDVLVLFMYVSISESWLLTEDSENLTDNLPYSTFLQDASHT